MLSYFTIIQVIIGQQHYSESFFKSYRRLSTATQLLILFPFTALQNN